MTTTATFTRLAIITASTKREVAPDAVTGKAGAPVTNIASLVCTPLIALDNMTTLQWRETLGLKTLVNLLETFTQGDLDIITGDTLVIGSAEYPIRFVNEWPFARLDIRHQLIIEALKR